LAPRLRTRADSRLVVAGLVALALLALGEQAPAAFPVHVTIEGHSANLQVDVDGQTHDLDSGLGGGWRSVLLDQPGPVDREYQVDGSDTTSTNDRDVAFLRGFLGTPLYALDAYLRDEGSYSRWEDLRITDLATGQPLSPEHPLPADFRVEANLRRPESPARLWLVGAFTNDREGLELDRDKRNARWMIQRGGTTQALPRWFFPEQPMPFLAELLNLLGRSAITAFALALAAVAIGRLIPRGRVSDKHVSDKDVSERYVSDKDVPEKDVSAKDVSEKGVSDEDVSDEDVSDEDVSEKDVSEKGVSDEDVSDEDVSEKGVSDEDVSEKDVSEKDVTEPRGVVPLALTALAALGCWLVASALVSVRLYHQLPHILDAVSYTFQAGLLASGQLSLAVPPQVEAFKGPFEVVWQGRLFSQYPPGAPAMYAIGEAVNLEWLVGPLACALMIGATAWSAYRLHGQGVALAVLGLGVISPFILFQSGSYLSHPIAGALLAAALAAFVAAECSGQDRWYAASGLLLGAAFTTREVASVLFALPLGIRLVSTRRWSALGRVALFGLPFLLAYLVYNLRETGNPLLLPRTIFDASDHFGFGDGIGFHTRHTLAAGLANTDELLTLLQFDAFGWPPLVTFGLLALPFLLGRARAWDWLAATGFLAFVAAYVGYFYHGVALGPRYYFEAMPWLLLLGGRAAQTIAWLAGSRLVPIALIGVLTLNTLLIYTPAELARRIDWSGLPGNPPISLGFVQSSLFGPHLDGVPSNSLVLTSDWWLYNTSLAPLNCPRLPNCDVLFALAMTPEQESRLRGQYPDRTVLQAVVKGDRVDLESY
jgi:hypothetical protein